MLGILNKDLDPLFTLLRGDSALHSPRHQMPEEKNALNKVSQALCTCQAHQMDPQLLFLLWILGKGFQPYALIFQWNPKLPDPLLILEWVFVSHQLDKTITTQPEMMVQLIMRARSHLISLAGKDFSVIFLPLTSSQLSWLI